MKKIKTTLPGSSYKIHNSKQLTKISAVLFLMLFNLAVSHLSAQKKKNRPYIARVTQLDGKIVEGILSATDENSITLRNKKAPESAIVIHPETIKKIKIRRKGGTGRGAAIGAGVGLLSGVILGYAQGDDPGCADCWWAWQLQAEDYALAYGVLLAPIGAMTGVIIGSKGPKFVIKGSREAYLDQISEIRNYAENGAEQYSSLGLN